MFTSEIRRAALEAFKTHDAIVSHELLPVYEELVKDHHVNVYHNVRWGNNNWEYVYQLRSLQSKIIGLSPGRLDIADYSVLLSEKK